MITVEKRLPFGFMGEWAKLYKLFTRDEKNESEVIEYQQNYYVDIGQDIQVRQDTNFNNKLELSQTVQNLVNKGEYEIYKTTDAYFDINSQTYKCVVELGDILALKGDYYVCDKIEVHNLMTPAKQSIYFLGLRKIFKVGVQNV